MKPGSLAKKKWTYLQVQNDIITKRKSDLGNNSFNDSLHAFKTPGQHKWMTQVVIEKTLFVFPDALLHISDNDYMHWDTFSVMNEDHIDTNILITAVHSEVMYPT